ncbi:MAG TPA: hypothetical protein VGI58_00880 [Streptosporangiaceae bacterium]
MSPSLSPSSLSPEEIRAAAETHRELGPDYRDAVVDSFLDRVGKEIDARVESRLEAAAKSAPPPARSPALAITSMAFGIPLTAIALAVPNSGQLTALVIIWAAIAVINVAYGLGNLSHRRNR